ncbi:MAG TPA: hypothetical protein VGS11_07605 [Candidatus Bathyarchaeia archaeon]|nr:hypothetical protein [Candidatus Bathyarchaeia archaeon]
MTDLLIAKPRQERKTELLEKAKAYQLTYDEAIELRNIIEQDKQIDELTKFLLIFGIGALIGYILAKD